MLKFLRQYNKWILAVGGTLLLITFLMPSAIQNCAQQSAVGGAVWATYEGGGELTGLDLDDARRELMLVEFLGNPDRRQDPIAFIGADRDPAHWWLLVHEAERAGLVGGQGEGLALIAARAAAQTAQGTPISTEQAIANLQRASESTREFVLVTASKWSAVMRLLALAESVDRVSDRRLEQFVAKTLLGINGDIVVVDARANMRSGVFGEMMLTFFKGRGGAGVVVDGCIRDFAAAKELGIGLWLRGSTPNFHTQTDLMPFAVNAPVACGDTLVMPGDIVVADDDGAVVVPAAKASAVLADAGEHAEWEDFSRLRLSQGGDLRVYYPLSEQGRREYEAWKRPG